MIENRIGTTKHMTSETDPPPLDPHASAASFSNPVDLAAQLHALARTGTPQVRALAAWLADRPEELAFHSVRSLAVQADTNANTVIRLARALGFSSFEPCRHAAQQALRTPRLNYAARVGALSQRQPEALIDELRKAAQAGVDALFSPASMQALTDCVPALREARRVHCIAVRMCFGLASYFTYVGALAHSNIAPTPAQPGLIMDSLSDCGPDDVVIAISFAHYSVEVVRGVETARAQGARVIAITDSHSSPIAQDAMAVLRPPMLGPHVMPSLAGAFQMMETLLALMAAQDGDAPGRVQQFEERLLRLGAYVPGSPGKS